MAVQQLYERVYQCMDNLLQIEKTFSENQEISEKLHISTFAGLEEVCVEQVTSNASYPALFVENQT
ncbi:hypothetical protein [Actinobacillus pleuropneumoniae]|uniref:hypothetical protein n=1 Tax=Actinobacillus pleuropneumoniae TaxID=715 RepID=UPI003CFF0954